MKYSLDGTIESQECEDYHYIGKSYIQWSFFEDDWKSENCITLEILYEKIGNGKRVKITIEEI